MYRSSKGKPLGLDKLKDSPFTLKARKEGGGEESKAPTKEFLQHLQKEGKRGVGQSLYRVEFKCLVL